ncbi:hypothetical protein LJC63_02840 [Ruminococcaceae bacterium OttesenSCG-928-L11]|nr:hypothetical protein [Ruminococcaceae bacterium OttesenSCG-928-L11]
MKSYKTKATAKKIHKSIMLYFSMPTLWVALILAICAVVCLLISIALNDKGLQFESSLFSNVFAGLITGFSIALLSGVKSVYCNRLEIKILWLEETHKMILDFMNTHHSLYNYKNMTDEEFAERAYDTGSRANWVNDRILHNSIFDKEQWLQPQRYFHRRYNYDSVAMCDVLNEFKDTLYLVGTDSAKRKEEVESFRPVLKAMTGLNKNILDDVSVLKTKLANSKKSFI